ncbi:hypothetical protein KCV07_g4280, partial [Aureobasidium melanogenum]
MSTSIHDPSQDLSRSSTRSRHRRSSISLHSKPGLGLIKTISKDFVHGWHTTTALQKEPSDLPSPAPMSQPYKPRYAARDAMKGFTPAVSCKAQDVREPAESRLNEHSRNPSRSRQDSLAPISPIASDATKPLAHVEAGLIPDHSFDTWTAAWDSAYERRVKTTHHCASPTFPTSQTLTSTPTSPTKEQRKRTRNTRPPLTGRLSVTDADVKRFVFGDRKDRRSGYESPESFLVPRRGSEVPSLVFSEGSSRDSGLEDLEEGDEESDEEVRVEINSEGKEERGLRMDKEGQNEKRFARVFVAPVVEHPEVV